jgi:hypothetical protein
MGLEILDRRFVLVLRETSVAAKTPDEGLSVLAPADNIIPIVGKARCYLATRVIMSFELEI